MSRKINSPTVTETRDEKSMSYKQNIDVSVCIPKCYEIAKLGSTEI